MGVSSFRRSLGRLPQSQLIPVCRLRSTSAYPSPVTASILHHLRSKTVRTTARCLASRGQLPTVIRRHECEGTRMVYTPALVLLWLFSGRGPPLLPRPVTTSARHLQTGYLVRIISPLVPLPHLSNVLLGLIAMPPSPTSLPPTQAPSIAPVLSMAKLPYPGMYVSPSFASRFFYCFLTYSNDTSATHSCRPHPVHWSQVLCSRRGRSWGVGHRRRFWYRCLCFYRGEWTCSSCGS